MQKVCAKEGMVHISNDKRSLEALVAKFKWKVTCAPKFQFHPIGCHNLGRVCSGKSCTEISRRSWDERNFSTCVNEERTSQNPILDMKKP